MSEPVCKTTILKYDVEEDVFEGRRWEFCDYRVSQHFDLPVNDDGDLDVKKAQFFGYERPGAHRVEVRLDRDGLIRVDGEQEFWMGETDDLIRAKLERHGTLYVECEYE